MLIRLIKQEAELLKKDLREDKLKDKVSIGFIVDEFVIRLVKKLLGGK